jgi:hypothetical protein
MITQSLSKVAAYYVVRVPNLRQNGKRRRGLCQIHGCSRGRSVEPETGLALLVGLPMASVDANAFRLGPPASLASTAWLHSSPTAGVQCAP